MRKIKDLINNEKKVYILLKNEDIARRFLSDAQAEGITFIDGSNPIDKAPDDIIALLPNGTICYVGYLGKLFSINDQCIRFKYSEIIC